MERRRVQDSWGKGEEISAEQTWTMATAIYYHSSCPELSRQRSHALLLFLLYFQFSFWLSANMVTNKAEIGEVESVTDPNQTGYDEKQNTNYKGVDDALAFIAGSADDEWTEEEERRVLRKIDFVVVPLV
jgi:hypothetical protein